MGPEVTDQVYLDFEAGGQPLGRVVRACMHVLCLLAHLLACLRTCLLACWGGVYGMHCVHRPDWTIPCAGASGQGV